MRLIDADKLKTAFVTDVDTAMGTYDGTMVEIMSIDIDECHIIDPIHAAGGCYCRECECWDDKHPVKYPSMSVAHCACGFWSSDVTVCTKPDDFCSFGISEEE